MQSTRFGNFAVHLILAGDSCCRFIVSTPGSLIQRAVKYKDEHPDLPVYIPNDLPGVCIADLFFSHLT